MENKFGIKDFFFLVVLLIFGVAVLLMFVNMDRHWRALQELTASNQQQRTTLADIDKKISNLHNVSVGNPENTAFNETFPDLLAAEKKPDFKRGDCIVENVPAKLKTISPVVYDDVYATWIHARVTESLVYRNPNTLEYMPQLATAWQISPDGLTYTFTLRDGVRFSDGVPVTIEDVKYSFDLPMNTEVDAARLRVGLEKIKSIQIKGANQIIFEIKEPYYQTLDMLGTQNIIPKHFYEKHSIHDINTKPGLLMGSGPYRVSVGGENWTPGIQLELVRNEFYWGLSPTFDKVVFREVEEEAATELEFKNGKLDTFIAMPDQFDRMKKDTKLMERANAFSFESPMNGYYYIAWNQKRNGQPTRFADKRVRKAMTMLCDRQGICTEIYRGYGKTISGPFSSGSPQADPNIAPLPFDPVAAKKLLIECGYRDNGSGQLVDPSGQPFKFRLTYPNKNETFARAVRFLTDGFSRAGVTLEPDPTEWPVVQERLKTRDFEVITLGWGGTVESDWYQEFDSSQIEDRADNFMSYNNPALDVLLRDARRTVDATTRMELWHKAHAILHEDQPYTFLLSRMRLRFMDNRIHNVNTSKLGLNFIYEYNMPMPWYVPGKSQKYTN